MCDCMNVIDGKLKDADANTRISRTYLLGNSPDGINAIPSIQTEKADKANRKRPMVVAPTYCPWCGLDYKSGQPAVLKAVAAGDAS